MSVRMRHEGVEQEIEVAEISVKHYERSGWKAVGKDGQLIEEKSTTAKRRRAEGDES